MKPEELPDKKVKYFYFLDGQKYESDTSSVNGANVRAKLPPEKAGYALFLEGHGQDPDKLVNDADGFSLEKHPPLRFYSVPPATFGQA
ncbi:MAG: hypothetical protein PSV22_08645 [Pseudolabrys sp.]|nr:hypothetical protein [Pseudolabrys sp.]